MLEVTTKEQFNEEIAEGVVLVDVYAPWCGPCKMIAPALEDLSTQYPNVTFVKVNADELKDVATELQVMSIPTIITMVGGSVIEKAIGFQPAPVIEEQIKRAIERSNQA